VNVLHEYSLVFEHITLTFEVKRMIQMLINLLGFPVLFKQTPQYSLPSHPQHLGWHMGIFSTLSFSKTCVPAFSSGYGITSDSPTRMNHYRFSNDRTILYQLSNVLSRVSIVDFISFIWIKPNLVFPTFHHSRCKPLL